LDKNIIFVIFTNVSNIISLPLNRLKKLKGPLKFLHSSHNIYDESLMEKGIYPPLPIYADSLIWGYSIIRTAEKEGIEELLCVQVPVDNPVEQLKIALKLENRCGNYSWAEKVKILQYLNSLDASREAFHISRYIENNNDSSWIKKAKIYQSLPENLKTLAENGHIDFKTASLVKELDDSIFLYLEENSYFSFTETRLFLTYFFEIIKRDNVDTAGTKELFHSLLSSNNPLEELKKIRFPGLTQMEKKYNTLHKKYIAKEGFRMTHPSYFEGDSFSISFSFNSSENFKKKIKKLKNIQDHIDEFFSLL